MELSKALKDEIWDYCRVNNISNIDEFTLKLIKQGFTIEKFGATPSTKVIEKEVEKIGSTGGKKIDVRIIAATNRDLEKSMHEGNFRQDLYYRLNVVTIHIPALRERTEDIMLIANHLVKKICKDLNKKVIGISKDSEYFLKNHH